MSENKYFTITEPYYALIRADDENQAVDEYIEVVSGDESDRDSLLEGIVETDEVYAIAKFITSPTDDELESHEDYFKRGNPLILLVDGSLI